MRTKTLLIAAVLGAAGLASASAQVTSVNAVGYVNKDLKAGNNLIANPLSNGENGISSVIPVAPNGTIVSLYNGAGYDQSQFTNLGIPALDGWDPEITLPVGAGFFINVSEDTTITFVGEVLQGDDSNKTVPQGISIQGSTVPVAGTLTEHGFPGGNGDTVSSWDAESQSFVQAQLTLLGIPALDGWSPAEPTLGVADAVFVDKVEEGAWDRNFSIN